MKNVQLSITLLCCLIFVQIGAGIAQQIGPRQSQKSTVIQRVGITDITIEYSRPAVKGRQVLGKVIRYKSRFPWRAGANENTTIQFAHDVLIDRQLLKAGKYGLHMLPAKDQDWTVIFSKKNEAWGSIKYNPKDDALRIKVKPEKRANHQEFLLYHFINLTETSATIALDWGKFRIPIKFAISNPQELVINDFRSKLSGFYGFTWRNLTTAGSYYLKHNKYLKEALAISDQAIRAYPKWDTYSLKSAILRKMGRTKEANELDDYKINTIANQGELNQWGYYLLNQKKFAEAIQIFELNVKKYPKAPNVYDSLAEGYMMKGDKKKAIRYYKKVLDMNPSKFLKNHASQQLKKLEGK